MSSFDKSIPIVNPRRYLKLVDHAASVLTDTEVKNMTKPSQENRDSKKLPGVECPNYDAPSLSDMECYDVARITAFLCAFFTEIRNIERTNLMQTMDDGIHSTFGIFIQTKNAQKLVEYQALLKSEKNLADRIIQMWKETEDDIREKCINEIKQMSISSNTADEAIRKFGTSMQDAEKAIHATNLVTPHTATMISAHNFVITNALKEVSKAYANILDYTIALETGITTFVYNVQSIINQECVPISILSIIGFPVSFNTQSCILRNSTTIYSNNMLNDTIRRNRGAIRRWFRNLQLTPPGLL